MRCVAGCRWIVLLTVSFFPGCGRPPGSSDNSGGQNLPFDRAALSAGKSPSQSIIPAPTKLAEGTPIVVRLLSPLSSASAHAGDTFSATLDEPVEIDGQALLGRGTIANGRVLEAKAAGNSLEPGYLRIVLVSVDVGGRRATIYTSSIFAKGGSREERGQSAGAASVAGRADKAGEKDRDIVFDRDRRLNFRLAQTVDLQ